VTAASAMAAEAGEGEVEVELEDEVDFEAPAEGEEAAADGEAAEAAADEVLAGEGVEEEAAEVVVEEEEGEPEDDDAAYVSAAACVKHEVSFSNNDATPNVFVAPTGVVSAFSQGPFAKLLAGVRANTGAKEGRYLYEVQVAELALKTALELRIGFSLAGSSLFLGDGSPDGIGFSRDGTYFVAEPGQLSCLNRTGACESIGPKSVIGVLLNLDASSKAANTVSIFLDGKRAGRPQPIPSHLRGKALYPTITFRGLSLITNLGRGGLVLRQLPFVCRMFAQMAEAHHERAAGDAKEGSNGPSEVLVPIALPDEGFFDLVRRLRTLRPDAVVLSDGEVFKWCDRSGLKPSRPLGPTHSLDAPDFAYGHAPLDSGAWRETLLTLAQLSGRSCVVAHLCKNLLRDEREALLKRFPPGVRKVAVVAIGEPSKDFKQWVYDTMKAQYDEKRALRDRRQLLAEASGIPDANNEPLPPEPPASPSEARRLPREDTETPEVAGLELADHYRKFSLPVEDEGFDEVRFEWQDRVAAEKYVRTWVLERKATMLVKDLKPGEWFKAKMDLWRTERKQLRDGHQEYDRKKKAGTVSSEVELNLDVGSIVDIHDADGHGTPLYACFKYEDWVLLAWRYELHLLAHAFVEDVADEDITGVPETHMQHYYEVYFKAKFEPKEKLGITGGIAAAVQLLREPLELQPGPQPSGPRVLRSAMPRDAPLEAFVKGVEVYRRDRKRRLEAGDESAQLTFPRPAPGGKAAVPAKAAPGKAALPAKAAPAKAFPAKAAPAMAHPGKAMPVRPAINKAAPAVARPQQRLPVLQAPAKAAPAAASGVKRPMLPQEALAGPGGIKRPMPPQEPPAKKPRPPTALLASGKAPIAKRKPATPPA